MTTQDERAKAFDNFIRAAFALAKNAADAEIYLLTTSAPLMLAIYIMVKEGMDVDEVLGSVALKIAKRERPQ